MEEKNDITTYKSPKEITSLEQMETWLTSLEDGASISVQRALKAQLEVIQFIQSPTLVSTTLDTLLLNLKKSIEKATNDEEKELIGESFSLMIQNYVFFFDARMQYAINRNKDEGRKIFVQAGEMLSKSVKEVALMAAGPATKAKVAGVIVRNIFEASEGENSFFDRLWQWFNRDSIIAGKKEQFYTTLYGVFKKLEKYQPLIGKSMLINGMIERYAPAMCDYVFPKDLEANNIVYEEFEEWGAEMERIGDSKKRATEEVDQEIVRLLNRRINFEELTTGCWAFTIVPISLIVALIRWIVKGIAGTNVEGWFATQMLWTFGIIGVIFIVLLMKEIFLVVRDHNEANRLKVNRDRDIAKRTKHYDDIKDNLQQRINKVYAIYQSRVDEFAKIAEMYNEL